MILFKIYTVLMKISSAAKKTFPVNSDENDLTFRLILTKPAVVALNDALFAWDIAKLEGYCCI